MPTRKKTTVAEAALPAGDVKPAPRRRTATTKPATAEPAESEGAAPKAKKIASAKNEKSAAATHKAPAKRATKSPETAPQAAPSFDVHAHRAEIEREAYFLWERRGGQHGSAHEDWAQAVEIVRARYL